MQTTTNSFWKSTLSTIIVLVSLVFLSFGLISSVNVEAATTKKVTTNKVVAKKVTTKKVVAKKVVQKIRYVESINTCLKPADRSYAVIKKFVAFDDINKCNDFAKSEKVKQNAQAEEVKTAPELAKLEAPSNNNSSTNGNTDYSNFISKISNSDNNNSSNSNKGSPPQAAGYSLLKQNCLF